MINYEPYQKFFNVLGHNKENILLIHNFISDEDLKVINEYLNSKADDDEFMGGKDLRIDDVFGENPDVARLVHKYEKKIYDTAVMHFTDRMGIPIVREAVNPTHFVKWITGMNSGLHCDCETHDGKPAEAADFYRYNVSVLAYPNDSYTGGEITFPEYGIVVKPVAGDLIMFPGNGAYKHTVEVVTSGIRYTMPSWYAFDVGNKNIRRTPGTYLDSVQLWPDNPDIDPVGIKVKDIYQPLDGDNNEKT